jgi:hypothetical protein
LHVARTGTTTVTLTITVAIAAARDGLIVQRRPGVGLRPHVVDRSSEHEAPSAAALGLRHGRDHETPNPSR